MNLSPVFDSLVQKLLISYHSYIISKLFLLGHILRQRNFSEYLQEVESSIVLICKFLTNSITVPISNLLYSFPSYGPASFHPITVILPRENQSHSVRQTIAQKFSKFLAFWRGILKFT